MVSGAATFRTIIAELTGFDTAEALSTPFLYAVHRDSLVSETDFERHLQRCADEFVSSLENDFTSAGYVDGRRRVEHQRLDVSLWNNDLDPEVFSAVFQTDELGVDPRKLASAVSRAVRDNDRVTLHLGARVHKVVPCALERWSLVDSEGFRLGIGDYDLVVNSSWSDLLRLDSNVGIPLPPEWSYRYKLGNRVLRPVSPDDLNSVTVVLGAFGDIVNYGQDGGLFLSWYPSGRLLMTDEIDLPDWNGENFRMQREASFELSKTLWESMSARVRALTIDSSQVDTRGGMILATGRLDVDDPASPLHSRVQVGLNQRGSYISINTGKYTMAPLMAIRAADAAASVVLAK